MWGNAQACSKPSVSASRSQILALGRGDQHKLTWKSVRHGRTFSNCPGSAPTASNREEEREAAVDTDATPLSQALPLPFGLRASSTDRKEKKKWRTRVLKGEIHRLEKECSCGSQGPTARLAQLPEAGWAPEDLTLTPQPWISKMDQLLQAHLTHLWPQEATLAGCPWQGLGEDGLWLLISTPTHSSSDDDFRRVGTRVFKKYMYQGLRL